MRQSLGTTAGTPKRRIHHPSHVEIDPGVAVLQSTAFPGARAIEDGYDLRLRAATKRKQRAEIVQEYVSRFPHMAWRPGSWFIAEWLSWRACARRNPEARAMLRAVARGITEPYDGYIGGLVTKRDLRSMKLHQAKAMLRQLRADPRPKRLYERWRESDIPSRRRCMAMLTYFVAKAIGVDVRKDATDRFRFGAKMLNDTATPHDQIFRAFQDRTARKGLAIAELHLIATLFHVRERDLHTA